MTKEIIIDGVDVAWCARLQDDKISCDLGGECNGWENCYYKQLKRLEQENKELKTQIKNNEAAHQAELSIYNMECGNLLEENKSLIEENEKLKKSNHNLKLHIETYQIPEVVKVLTDWRSGELDLQEKRLKKLEADNKMYKKDTRKRMRINRFIKKNK